MATSSTMPTSSTVPTSSAVPTSIIMPTPSPASPTLIGLPLETLIGIALIVNESDDTDTTLAVGPDLSSLVLTHRRFLEAADEQIAEHQHNIKIYREVVIDSRSEPTSSQDTALHQNMARLKIAYNNNTTMFDSPPHMLIDMHKGKVIPSYVRSLVYLAPAEGSDEGPGCSRTALDVFGCQKIVDDWDKWLSATMDGILPECATAHEKTSWVKSLWEEDYGEGITLLLQSLHRLTSLSLSGGEEYLTVRKSYSIGDSLTRAPT